MESARTATRWATALGFALALLGAGPLSGCSCKPTVTHLDEVPIRASPTRVDFPATFVGYSSRRSLELTNPNRFTVAVTAVGSGPFALAVPLAALEAGATSTVELVFRPTATGASAGHLFLNALDLPLAGEGVEAPVCASAACRTRHNDPSTGACVEAVSADGADCTASTSCFQRASCQDGECVGTLTSCSDFNPCTLDVCGESGCGHLDGLSACPEPDDPCQVPTCDQTTGCGQAAAADGTECGVRTCHDANVCINGKCVLRRAPQNQACVEVLAGVPAGSGTSDGVASLARFRALAAAVYDDVGNLYVLDRCAVRRVSPSGIVKTIAGVVDNCASSKSGAGLAAGFNLPTAIVFDGTQLIVRDSCALRRVSLHGLVTDWVGAGCESVDGIGARASLLSGTSLDLSPDRRRLSFLDTRNELDGGISTLLREVTVATGELKTVARVALRPPAPPENTSWLNDTLVSTADGGLFTCVLDQTIIDQGSFGETQFLVQVGRDGSTRNVSEGRCLMLRRLGTDLLIAGFSDLTRFDGSHRTPVAGTTPEYLDGPVDQARFGFVAGAAVNDAGIAVVDSIYSNVRRVSAGQVTTLTGPRPDQRSVDGPTASARLLWSGSIAAREDGLIFFFDYEALREIDSTGKTVTLIPALGRPQDGVWADAGFRYPTALVALGDGLWTSEFLVQPDGGFAALVRRLDCSSGQLTTLAEVSAAALPALASSAAGELALGISGDLYGVDASGVLSPKTPPLPGYPFQLVASDGAAGWFGGSGSGLYRLDGTGAFSTLADSAQWPPADGPLSTARFGSISALAADPAGNLFIVDRNLVRRYSPSTGLVTTLFELSDAPVSIAVEPSGALLVVVSTAVLRLKP